MALLGYLKIKDLKKPRCLTLRVSAVNYIWMMRYYVAIKNNKYHGCSCNTEMSKRSRTHSIYTLIQVKATCIYQYRLEWISQF